MSIEKVTEIAVWSKYTPGPVEDEIINITSKQEGFLAFRRGAAVNDPSIGYWVVDWETLDHHKKLQESEIYPSIIEKAKAVGQIVKLVHFTPKPFPPSKALEAPVTEVVFRTLKDKSFKPELDSASKSLGALLKDAKGIVGVSAGGAIEDESLIIALLGWESVEAYKVASSHPAAAPAFEILGRVSDAEVTHVKFSTIISKE